MLPPYLWGRPPVYCSPACERRYHALRRHLIEVGLLVPPPPKPKPERRVIGVWVREVVVIDGVEYERVWHGAVEGHWAETRGGLCV